MSTPSLWKKTPAQTSGLSPSPDANGIHNSPTPTYTLWIATRSALRLDHPALPLSHSATPLPLCYRPVFLLASPCSPHLTSSEAQGRRGTALSSESPLNSWSEGGGAMWRGTWNAPCR